MTFWLAFLALPKEVILLIVAAIVLLVLSILSIVFPVFGNFLFGIGFLAGAFFLKDMTIKLRKATVSIGAILAIMGIGIILFNLLQLNLSSLGISFVVATLSVMQPVAMATGVEVAGIDLGTYGITAEVATSLAIVVIATTAAVLLLKMHPIKRRR